MAVLTILTGETNPVLRTKTTRVEKVTKDILKILNDMKETTVSANGLGIAGPQVNHSMRLCIVTIGGKMLPLINPDITWKGTETDVVEEGCLSLPGLWMDVQRPTEITVKYLDGKGKEQERRLKGLDARVVQHEVDHLDGVLIVDYAAPTRRSSPPAPAVS